MKMNRIAIMAVLVISLLGVTMVSGCIGGNGILTQAGPGGIAIPADYVKGYTDTVEGYDVSQYIADSNNPNHVLNDLKQSAEDAGWSLISDGEVYIGGYIGGTALEKGDEMMVIQVVEAGDQVTAFILIGPLDDSDINDNGNGNDLDNNSSNNDAPTTDAPGQDISDVPRYPGSTRTESFSMGDEDYSLVMVWYLSDAGPDEIKDFYEYTLEAEGWESTSTNRWVVDGEVHIILTAEKLDREVVVSVNPSDHYDGMTSVTIALEEY